MSQSLEQANTQWIDPDDTLEEFVRKYPIAIDFFQESVGQDQTIREYTQSTDTSLEDLEQNIASHLMSEASDNHEDCQIICLTPSWCNRKVYLFGLLSLVTSASLLLWWLNIAPF